MCLYVDTFIPVDTFINSHTLCSILSILYKNNTAKRKATIYDTKSLSFTQKVKTQQQQNKIANIKSFLKL